MNAETPSSASERTWKVTSRRLWRFTMRSGSAISAAISSPKRARLKRFGVRGG